MDTVVQAVKAEQVLRFLEQPVLNAENLRLGNTIFHVMKEPLGFVVERVYSLGEQGINNPLNIPNAANQPYYRGIPITPTLLEKAGFVHDDRTIWRKETYWIHYVPGGGKCGFGFKEVEGIFATLNYLHQLQNLYYALTGKELEINL